MFKENKKHLQKPLFSSTSTLPEKQRKRLENSWANTFYTEIFCRLDERIFEILYSDQASRPNVPVNILMGLEILKDGNGWTDEEMYSNFSYNIQVRYALGLYHLDEGHFELRTTYNFRQRLVKHMQETGENLWEVCFEQITDEQMEAYAVKSRVQRVDSKQIASNIRQTTRLQLLVEVMGRAYRMLDGGDKLKYKETFDPYIKGSSGKYMYRLKGEKHRPHIKKIGKQIATLLPVLQEKYEEEPEYKILKRVFGEHFKEVEGETEAKEGAELSAESMQSPDDLEATFRSKRGEGHVGYVVNVTETVDAEGGLQLITKVQIAPNTTDDAKMLNEALPDLKERTDLETIYSDGTYNSPEVDDTCREESIVQIPTGIRGSQPNKDTLTLSDFKLTLNTDGQLIEMHCPHGHAVDLASGRQDGRFIARVPTSICPDCATHDKRDSDKAKASPCFILYFSRPQIDIALRRQRLADFLASGSNPRAAVEATVRELTCRFSHATLRVRGQCRMAMSLLASATMCNARRIWRFNLVNNAVNETENIIDTSYFASNGSFSPYIALVRRLYRHWLSLSNYTHFPTIVPLAQFPF